MTTRKEFLAASVALAAVSSFAKATEDVWNRTVGHAKKRAFNMVVMDRGEFVKYPSHPELAVAGSWSAEKMHGEVKRLRAMGLEPIPKLNFSGMHYGNSIDERPEVPYAVKRDHVAVVRGFRLRRAGARKHYEIIAVDRH